MLLGLLYREPLYALLLYCCTWPDKGDDRHGQSEVNVTD